MKSNVSLSFLFKNLLNLISQRKSVSTPNISNGEPVFSVSSTEQASSAENLISSASSRTTDHSINVNNFFVGLSLCNFDFSLKLMEGFHDQIARQYDALVVQTQLEPTLEEPLSSVWLSSSTEDFLTPIHSDTSNTGNWLELNDYTEETLLVSKGLLNKRENLKNNYLLVFRRNKR